MRVIKIDPYVRTIEDIQIVGNLDSMVEIIGDGPCMVRVAPNDVLWVDDEGFLKEGVPVFNLRGYESPLAGIGLIIGLDDLGENVAAEIPLAVVQANVIWTETESTGKLEPTREYVDGMGRQTIRIGAPILRERLAP